MVWDLVKDVSDYVKDAMGIVRGGLDYKGTRKTVESTMKQLTPLVEKIEHSMRMMDLPTDPIERLKEIISANKSVLGKRKIRWWNRIVTPYYQSELSDEFNSLERFISVEVQVLMLRLLTEILPIVNSDGPSHQSQNFSARNSDYNRTPMFKGNLSDRFSQFTVGLDGHSVMNKLKHELINGGEQVLNLYGLPGSGKTTLAGKLCLDLQVKGKFKYNIMFETLGSQIQSNEAINRWQYELSKYGKNPVLLVLDDVWPQSGNIVEELKHHISPDSRILVTSIAQIKAAKIRYPMELLCDEDAETLFRHFVQQSDIDFDDPDIRQILLQIVKGCKGLPLAIEFIGHELRGKDIEELQKVQLEWSRGYSILDSHTDLFTRLRTCFDILDESIKECFMDLGLFPEDQRIPVNALIDIWSELYDLNEPGSIYGMIIIKKLIGMNLAAGLQVRRTVGRDVDNCYNSHFLTQHDLFRDLAIRMSSGDSLENRRRLIIDMNGNHRPQGWPLHQQSVAASILSISTDQNITPDWCKIQAAGAEVLVLNLKTTEYWFPKFIKEMEHLKVVIVTNYGFRPTELKNFELLGSLWCLKRIRLQQVSIPSLCEFKNVNKLSLYMCEVKAAFENCSMQFSEALPNLEDLNIEYCKDLVELPSGLCNIVTMKNLTISSCHKFTGLPQEIGNLTNLESVRISYCANFEEMPESFTKLKLKFLDISYCVSLGKLPDNFGELQNLAKFYMTGCPVWELPDSVMDFKNLQSVLCDEYTYPMWEVIKSCLSGIHIKTATMDIGLDWLPDFGSRGFFL